MRHAVVLTLAMMGCDPATPDQQPPPGGLHLAVSTMTSGERSTFTTANAAPGERVYFGVTAAGTSPGGGLCPASVGVCLDLLNPITLLGTARANSQGIASLSLTVPPVNFDSACVQSAVLGAPGDVSQSVCRPVFDGTALPWRDDAFASDTPLPDADIIVVREAAYDAVDLTDYGYGPSTHIQSIYLRVSEGDQNQVKGIIGSLRVSGGAQILGVIRDVDDLGGGVDDGIWTASDFLFGIGASADDYSGVNRAFDVDNSVLEYLEVVDSTRLDFALQVEGGIDDVRVLIDHGSDWQPSATLDIHTWALGSGREEEPVVGIRLGMAGAVPAAADYGENGVLTGIPLTGNSTPTSSATRVVDPGAALFSARDTALGTVIDVLDPELDMPLLQHAVAETPTSIQDVTDGNDGNIYAIGTGVNLTRIDPVTGAPTPLTIPSALGFRTSISNLPGSDLLYITRDTSGDSAIDTFDTTTDTLVVDAIPLPNGPTTPAGITDGADGQLWVLGRGGSLVSVDPATGATAETTLSPPRGFFTDLSNLPGSTLLFLARDTISASAVDTYDVTTGIYTADAYTLGGSVPLPQAISDAGDGEVYVQAPSGNIARLDGAGAVDVPWLALADDYAGLTSVSAAPSPDADGDGIPTVLDNCPAVPNPGQADDDLNGTGNACEP